MLKKIRSLNFGWFVILLGLGAILSGFKMNSGGSDGPTLLCFDDGCLQVQGHSNIILGVLMIGLGIYMRYFKNR